MAENTAFHSSVFVFHRHIHAIQCLARMYAVYRIHIMAQLWYQKQKRYRWRVRDRFEKVLQLFLYLWLSLKQDLSKLNWSKTSSSSLQFAFLQITGTFTPVCVIGYVAYWYFYKTGHIMYTLYVYLTFISGGWRGWSCSQVSTHLSMTLLTIFYGDFRTVSSSVCSDKSKIFLTRHVVISHQKTPPKKQPKSWSFPNPNQMVCVPEPNRTIHRRCHNITIKFNPE